MNKLVSRNPVQRFKQGRKIEKFQGGGKKYYLTNNGDLIYETPENVDALYSDAVAANLTNPYNITTNSGYKFKIGSFDGGKTYYRLDTRKKLDNNSAAFLTRKATKPEKVEVGKTGEVGDTSGKNTRKVTTPVEKDSNNSFKLAFDTARNSGEQEFTWNGRKFNTMKKGETKEQWLSNLRPSSPELPTSEQLIQQVPQNVPVVESTPQLSITEFIPQTGTNTIQNQLSLMQQTLPATGTYIQTPTYVTADRSQTRDWMRSNGINPYSVTGAMRAAARRIRAGQADDNDRLLVKGNEQLYNLLKGYYKQGGNINKLPSRNIVERFKQRNFR